jgi:hypothetical protein
VTGEPDWPSTDGWLDPAVWNEAVAGPNTTDPPAATPARQAGTWSRRAGTRVRQAGSRAGWAVRATSTRIWTRVRGTGLAVAGWPGRLPARRTVVPVLLGAAVLLLSLALIPLSRLARSPVAPPSHEPVLAVDGSTGATPVTEPTPTDPVPTPNAPTPNPPPPPAPPVASAPPAQRGQVVPVVPKQTKAKPPPVQQPPAAPPPPPPATINAAGHLTCLSGKAMVGVWVVGQAGGSGWAAWTSTAATPSYASFHRTINNGPWQVHVGCGGTPDSWKVATYSGWVTAVSPSFTCDDIPGHARYGECWI